MKKAVVGILITVLVLGLGTTSALAAGQEDRAAASLSVEWDDYGESWSWGHMDLDGDGVCDFYSCDGADHWCPDGTWGCWGGHGGYGGCGGRGCWSWNSGDWNVGAGAWSSGSGSGSQQVSYTDWSGSAQGYGYGGHGCGGARGGCRW